MQNDIAKYAGHPVIVLYGPDGREKDRRDQPNLIVTVGKNWIASRLGPIASAPADAQAIALGTGTNAPAAGDTTLQAEIAGSRTATTPQGGTVSGNVNSYSATFGPGVGTGNITEAGLFNAMSAGTMVARTTFAGINKAAGDTLAITWSITNS